MYKYLYTYTYTYIYTHYIYIDRESFFCCSKPPKNDRSSPEVHCKLDQVLAIPRSLRGRLGSSSPWALGGFEPWDDGDDYIPKNDGKAW